MLLCTISVIEVFSATSTLAYKQENYWEPIVDHSTKLLAGFFAVLIIHNWANFPKWLAMGIFVSIVLLVITPFIGVSINGERRWLSFFGLFNFQPSELAKLCAVCFMAFVLSRRKVMTSRQMFWWILSVVGLTCLCILYNNGSTAIMLGCVMLMMMFIGQVGLKRILALVGTGVALIALMFTLYKAAPNFVGEYLPRMHTWMARIERFADDDRHQTDESGVRTLKLDYDEHFQEDLAKIAIAQGGIIGKMPGRGHQRDFLPQAFSDFIYAIIIEETGLIGGFGVLLLYFTLLIRAAMIARKCDKLFSKFLILGCALMIVTQALINMAVAVGVFPVTGQPLPLISRGGTSTIITCCYIGIMLSVSRYGANIGNDPDPLPEEDRLAAETSLPGVSEEEINNWVQQKPE